MTCFPRGLVLPLLLLGGCATAPNPSPPSLPATTPAVVLVPGVTGSRLCDRATGAVLWGDTTRLIVPRDDGRRLAIRIPGEGSDLEPCGVIREMRVGPWKKDIYGGLIDFLERNGHHVVPFDHDWRRDNIENARLLSRALERLAATRATGRVHLICQSNGTYICRYLARHGDVSLEEAEHGVRRPPAGVEIEKVILVGTANGGAIRILRELNTGRQYFALIGRRMRPETLFTFRSLYQDLPVYDPAVIEGVSDPDLFNATEWRTYGWSVFEPATAARLDRADSGLFGTEAQRLEFLRDALDRARRLHRLLRTDVDADLPRYYSMQSIDRRTPARALLVFDDGRWQTRISDEADPPLTAPGDGHATAASQHWLSGSEMARLDAPYFLPGRHFEMITTSEARARLLRILHEPVETR